MKMLALLASVLVAGCSTGAADSTGNAFPAEPLTTIESAGSMVSLEVRTSPEQPPTRGTISAELTAKDASGKLRDDLDITVDTWMPAMGHGASVVPTVTAAGNGVYLVSNVDLFMQGGWELRAKIGGPLNDSATIPLEIP